MRRIILAGAIASAGLIWSAGTSVASDDEGGADATEVTTTVETAPETTEQPETPETPEQQPEQPERQPETPEALEQQPGTTEQPEPDAPEPSEAHEKAEAPEPTVPSVPDTTLPDEEPAGEAGPDHSEAPIEQATAIVPLTAMAAGGPELSLLVDTVVYGQYQSRTELASTPTGEFEGHECTVAAVGLNQGSVHPDNDLVVSSGGGSVTMFDVERAPGATTLANGTLTLGSDVTVTLVMGPHTVFSGGFDVTFDCEPPFVPEKLRLTFMQECAQDGDPSGWTATWRIRNGNEVPVAYRVIQAGGGFQLEGEAPVGDSFVTTDWGSRTLILRTLDADGGPVAQDVKAGGDTSITADQDPDKCGEPVDPDEPVDPQDPVGTTPDEPAATTPDEPADPEGPEPTTPDEPATTTPDSPQEGLRSTSSSTGRSLPSTGSDVTLTTLLIASALVVLGGSALAVRRRARV